MTITIVCLVKGSLPANAFAVDIDSGKLVSHLKEFIKVKKQNDFASVDADRLKLWKVEIPDNRGDELADPSLHEELLATKKISKYFPTTPPEECIHVIVGPPDSTKEINCTASYGRNNTVKFQWPANQVRTTQAELKSRLRTCFTFPDGTEDEHITISREIGSGKERTTTRILNDTDLVNIIWSDSFKGDLVFVIDTSQQPFSSWTFGKMKVTFGLSADSYDQLPRFKGGVAETPEDIRKAVIEEILRMHKVSPPITSANEATRSEFISAAIYGVASIFNGEIKIYPQYEIAGSHGKGPIDWVIMVDDVIITVTEAKREDINQGIAQNAVQLQASLQRNRKKRSYDDALHEDVMYGIVSTGVDWVIIKVVSSGGNGEGNVEVFLSSRSPHPLPINHPSLDHDQLAGPLEEIFGQIKWVFDQQIETKGKQKRQRRE